MRYVPGAMARTVEAAIRLPCTDQPSSSACTRAPPTPAPVRASTNPAAKVIHRRLAQPQPVLLPFRARGQFDRTRRGRHIILLDYRAVYAPVTLGNGRSFTARRCHTPDSRSKRRNSPRSSVVARSRVFERSHAPPVHVPHGPHRHARNRLAPLVHHFPCDPPQRRSLMVKSLAVSPSFTVTRCDGAVARLASCAYPCASAHSQYRPGAALSMRKRPAASVKAWLTGVLLRGSQRHLRLRMGAPVTLFVTMPSTAPQPAAAAPAYFIPPPSAAAAPAVRAPARCAGRSPPPAWPRPLRSIHALHRRAR